MNSRVDLSHLFATDYQGGNGWQPLSQEASLQEVINALVVGRISRAPLVDDQGSLSDLSSFLLAPFL